MNSAPHCDNTGQPCKVCGDMAEHIETLGVRMAVMEQRLMLIMLMLLGADVVGWVL